jgi:hypothetical protein
MLLADKDKYNIRNMQYKVASSKNELEQAYSLVYKTYLASKLTRKYRCPLRLSAFNALPSTTTFISKLGRKIVGTVTLIPDSEIGIPMDKIYKKEVDAIRRPGRKIAEAGMLGTARDFFVPGAFSLLNAKKMIFLFKLFKLLVDYALSHAELTDLCIAVHPKHARLYEFLKFRRIGKLKYYSSVNKKPAVALHLDLVNVRNVRLKSKISSLTQNLYKLFFGTSTPKQVLQKKYIFSEKDLRYFFVEKSNIFNKITQKQIEYIKSCYPGYDFKKILSSK